MSSSNPPPTAPTVSESAVINAHIAQVWHLIKLPDFPTFLSTLDKAEEVKGASPETDIVRWTFKDGTKQDVKQEEHSVSAISPVAMLWGTFVFANLLVTQFNASSNFTPH